MLRPVPLALRSCLTAIGVFTAPLRPAARTYVKGLLVEELNPIAEKVWPHRTIRYFVPGRWPLTRASEGKSEMTDWIDSFTSNAVFWDIGSNVGVYSLYAASKNIRTIAFEPEAATFHLLQRNIDLNGLHSHITGINIGLNDVTGTAGFQLSDISIATPRHQVTTEVKSQAELPCRTILVMTARDAVATFGLPKPTHINVDVDGIELSVVRGLGLDDKGLLEVKCEMRRNGAAPEIVAELDRAGFSTQGALEAVENSPGKVANFIFRRR